VTDKPKYKLTLNVAIQEVDANGYTSGLNNRLEVRDSQELGSMDFLRIAGVLGRFHDLAQAIAAGDDAEPEPAPEPVNAAAPAGDAPFGEIRSFDLPAGFLSAFTAAGGRAWPPPPRTTPRFLFGAAGAGAGTGPAGDADKAADRVAKRTRQLSEARAALCGCDDPKAHQIPE
jgi:hypothetical protein